MMKREPIRRIFDGWALFVRERASGVIGAVGSICIIGAKKSGTAITPFFKEKVTMKG
jgi:hypothetical protein